MDADWDRAEPAAPAPSTTASTEQRVDPPPLQAEASEASALDAALRAVMDADWDGTQAPPTSTLTPIQGKPGAHQTSMGYLSLPSGMESSILLPGSMALGPGACDVDHLDDSDDPFGGDLVCVGNPPEHERTQ